eukprot:6358783-Prymnesium_polylepis.1
MSPALSRSPRRSPRPRSLLRDACPPPTGPVTFPHSLSDVEESYGYEAFLKAKLAASRDAETTRALMRELSTPRERLLRPSRSG